MSLTTEETQILNALPEDLIPYADAQMHKKFKAYNAIEQKGKCKELIIQFYKDTNTKNVDAQILASQRDELIRAFKGANADLTIEEAKRAFEMGVAGQSGPYFGGCYKSYVQFLNYYRTRPEREKSIKLFIERTKPAYIAEKPIIDWKEIAGSIVNQFNHYKEFKSFQYNGVIAPATYDTLKDRYKLITWTKEERNEIAAKCEKEYTDFINKAIEMRPRKAEELKQCLVTMANGENRTYNNLLKKEALTRYFDKLIRESINLEEVLK